MGDFNIPGYIWLNESNYSTAIGFHTYVNFTDAALMFEWCKLYNLVQLNVLKNSSGDILDLVFSNFYQTEVTLSNKYLLICDETHHPLSILFFVSNLSYCESFE